MTVVLTDNANYSAIASAIRGKNGTQATYAPSEMAAAITAIPTGSATLGTKSITENGTYDATDDSLDGYSQVTVSVPSGGGGGNEDGIIARSLSVIHNSTASRIGSAAFYQYHGLTEVSFDACEVIWSSAFYSCNSLTTVSFPTCKSVREQAFIFCSQLSAANFPMCEHVYNGAFYRCSGLTTASFPMCSWIEATAFSNCKSLTTAYFPIAAYVGGSAFIDCVNLLSAYFPSCKSIEQSAFMRCSNISEAFIPRVSYISMYAFMGCYRLLSLNLTEASSVVKMNATTTFSYTPIAGYTSYTDGQLGSIYVPSSLYDAFISASYWSAYSERFVSV